MIFGALLTFNKPGAVGIFHKTFFCRQKATFCQNVERHISMAFYLESNKDKFAVVAFSKCTQLFCGHVSGRLLS